MENICQLVDYYLYCNLGYVLDREKALDRCMSLPFQKDTVVLREFIKNATDNQYISLIGNAYSKSFHQLEVSLIQASNFSIQPLSQSDLNKLVNINFQGQISNIALHKMITNLKIRLEGTKKSKAELDAEREEKEMRAESVLKEYKVPQFQKRLNRNDLQNFVDVYDFLNYRNHIKIKDLEFPATQFSKESSFNEIRTRLDYLRAQINGKSDNTTFKIYDNLLIELDKYFINSKSKEKYDNAISFDGIRKIIKKDCLENEALKIIFNWSNFSNNKEEVECFVSSLFMIQTGKELEVSKLEKIDYFHCICGRMIPDDQRKCCPICRSRNKKFNSVELDEYLLDVFLKLGMFETARISDINRQKVQNAKNNTFESFYESFSRKYYYDALVKLETISNKYEMFENIVRQEELTAKQAVRKTEELVKILTQNISSRDNIQETLLEIYRTTADYPRIEQLCQECIGTSFSQFIKSVELLKFNMDNLSVVLTDRFGMGYDLRLKLDTEILSEISRIQNFQVILVEGNVSSPEDGKRLRPFYLDSSQELFKKKIRLLSSEIQSKEYTLFFSNGESYSSPKYFEVT